MATADNDILDNYSLGSLQKKKKQKNYSIHLKLGLPTI